jgi:rare lipoprotein A
MAQSRDVELARGRASWYGPTFHGRRTSSGERFDMNELTAAHATLPFGTRVRVRNVANGREVVVRINDRGPRVRDRIIDLSKAAAAALGFLRAGEAPVVLIEH